LPTTVYAARTIDSVKKDLDRRAVAIRTRLARRGGDARVAALKAVETQASAAIAVMPIYLSSPYKVMMDPGTHVSCIQQAYRPCEECLYSRQPRLDAQGRYRLDDRELRPEVQATVEPTWAGIDSGNCAEGADFEDYKRDFRRPFRFDTEGVDYDADVSRAVEIRDLV
jgi:enoyl-[acyl-carrier protein] reductase/trans-2-enoyl-CoA reductase (NAD+)